MIRRGFTLIELLLVLSIVLILVAMGFANLGDSLRRAQVRTAAADIIAACDMARQLALQDNAIGDVHYGVRLRDDPSQGPAMVEVVVLSGGSVSTLADPVSGQATLQRQIPSAVVVWEGDGDLRSGSGELTWFFHNQDGKPRLFNGGGLSDYTIEVGRRAGTVTQNWQVVGYTGKTAPTLAPATADNPGLSLRSSDNQVRIAVGVFASGMAYRKEYTGSDA